MSQKMWFGTEQHMEWIDLPLSGAESSAQAWGASGTLLNGGGHAETSFGAHRLYQYSWGNASAKRAASRMEAYRRGTYGRGLLYFHDPLTYDTNILPAHWADPSSAISGEAPSLFPNVIPSSTGTPENHNRLPVLSARYSIPAGSYPGDLAPARSLYIPIPPGFTMRMTAWYESTSPNAGIYVTPIQASGIPLTHVKLSETLAYEQPISAPMDARARAVRLWLGATGTLSSNATVTIAGVVARLIPIPRDSHENFATHGGWEPGDGHSGCRFEGVPTRISYSGVNGGQVGYAASFREVGAWQ